jgi:L-threonylcarbamoyladenylate synthase
VAAPSANLFGRPSPTTARHVLDDLDGRIDAIVDGGPTMVGVESTIVDVSSSVPRLLRPGGLAAEAIEAALGVRLLLAHEHAGPQEAPGMLAAHYAPRTPLTLVLGPRNAARERLLDEVRRATDEGRRVGVIALEEDVAFFAEGVQVEVVARWNEADEAARRLFDAMRALDGRGLDVLFARELAPSSGLGRALADRLRRASQRVIDIRD